MKYYLIAGEASGDLHGSRLMQGLLKSDPQAQFRFWGGDKMAAVGGGENLVKHYRETSFFGITEVVKNLRTVLSQVKECKRDLAAWNPDVVIHIDYPGFNFKIAKFAHEAGFRTFYYISPKVWAWKESRVKRIRKHIDRLFIIFPFEIEYFRKRGIEAIYEGNPLVDSIDEVMKAVPSREEFFAANGLDERPVVALLAGSRRNEIRNSMPFMTELAGHFPQHQFVVAGVPWLDESIYDDALNGTDVKCLSDKTYELLRYCDAAVVTSGTATLEAALIGAPEMVCYRTDGLSVAAGRLLIKVRFISLVNLIMDREVVRELIQGDMNMENAAAELTAILPGGVKHERMVADYDRLREIVGGPGASDRFAARMVEILKNDR